MFESTKQHVTFSTPPGKMTVIDAEAYCQYDVESDSGWDIVKPFGVEENLFFGKYANLYWTMSEPDDDSSMNPLTTLDKIPNYLRIKTNITQVNGYYFVSTDDSSMMSHSMEMINSI